MLRRIFLPLLLLLFLGGALVNSNSQTDATLEERVSELERRVSKLEKKLKQTGVLDEEYRSGCG